MNETKLSQNKDSTLLKLKNSFDTVFVSTVQKTVIKKHEIIMKRLCCVRQRKRRMLML